MHRLGGLREEAKLKAQLWAGTSGEWTRTAGMPSTRLLGEVPVSLLMAVRASPEPGRLERLGARLYDLMMGPVEAWAARPWRRRLWEGVRGKVLEVGIGTGANLPFHPEAEVIGVDLSAGMLSRTRAKAQRLGRPVALLHADLHDLPFPDRFFDYIVGSFVFCSVADPIDGLRELRRVIRPEGEFRLLEHVRPRGAAWGYLLAHLAPHFAKRTLMLFPHAGWEIVWEEALVRSGLVRLIVARPKGGRDG